MTSEWRIPGSNRGPALPDADADMQLIKGATERHTQLTDAIERLERLGRNNPIARNVARNRRLGSAMSDKQMARAAVDRRKLIFRTGVLVPLEGYVVGMDDYHWLIATPSEEDQDVQTTLIHKSCPLVTFTGEYLQGELDEDREAIEKIGKSFWEFCQDSGLSRSVPTIQEKKP